ncbi:hypothetical protein MASR2M16_37650 [Thauera terpenica]
MKILLALVVPAISWYPIGLVIYQITQDGDVASLFAAVTSVLIFYFLAKRITGADNLKSLLLYFQSMIGLDFDGGSSSFYAQAEKECESGNVDKGLWSQALVKAKGDESRRKIEYMKLRVRNLQRVSNNSRKVDE